MTTSSANYEGPLQRRLSKVTKGLMKRCLAAVASFVVPGLGQFLNGENKKALAFFSLMPARVLIAWLCLIPRFPILPMYLVSGGLWVVVLYSAYDGFRNAPAKMQPGNRLPWKRMFLAAGVCLVVFLGEGLSRVFVVESYYVPTASTEPTILQGDYILADKRPSLERGRLVLFIGPTEPRSIYFKRVVGLPGDRIAFKKGVLYVNGQAMKTEPVVNHPQIVNALESKESKLYVENLMGVRHYISLDDAAPNGREMEEVEVPPGRFMAVGDNRDHSFDSRSYGFTLISNLKGTVKRVWFSKGESGIRWWRLGIVPQ